MDREQRRHWRLDVFSADMTAAQKVILLALETFADFPAGTNARPGIAALAKMCGLGTRVVDSALAEGQRRGFIEQTARANPKRGLAAVYRLLSTRTSVRTEQDSTRTSVRTESGFNPHETTFQSAQNDVSIRTGSDFNPHERARHQSSNTNPIPTQSTEGARARETAPAPAATEQTAPTADSVAAKQTDDPPAVGVLLEIREENALTFDGERYPWCCPKHPQGTEGVCRNCGIFFKKWEASPEGMAFIADHAARTKAARQHGRGMAPIVGAAILSGRSVAEQQARIDAVLQRATQPNQAALTSRHRGALPPAGPKPPSPPGPEEAR